MVAALSEWATKQDFSKAILRVKELSEVEGLDSLTQMVSATKTTKPVDGLLFGSIGLLAHSSEAQWRAFNQALREKYPQRGSEIEWDRETYVESLKACGGRKRLRPFLESKGVAASEADIEEIYQRKTAIFLEHIRKNGVTIWPGGMEMLLEAKAKGLKPEPDCHLYAKQVLGLLNPLAFEDTQISMAATRRAGVLCEAALSGGATKQGFLKALLRV